ncbi:MAG TPA: alpha/beta fold hydrolase [Noviherbaspirillum sp.]|nr:alpha/beta fold hydrolase [Noviherbaspirillum sp.]
MNALVVFTHGKESAPWGSKFQHLADIAARRGANVISPDYRDLESPEARVERLLSLQLPPYDQLVLVGSSMGAYVATLASQALQPDGLFLLAPAFYLPGYANQDPAPHSPHVLAVHGWGDELIPPENVLRFGKRHHATVVFTEGDHRLATALPTIGSLFDDFLARQILRLPGDDASSDRTHDAGLGARERDYFERSDRNPDRS